MRRFTPTKGGVIQHASGGQFFLPLAQADRLLAIWESCEGRLVRKLHADLHAAFTAAGGIPRITSFKLEKAA